MDKVVKSVVGGVCSAYANISYTNFSRGREKFDKEELEQWVKSPQPDGLGVVDARDEEEISEFVSFMCLRLRDKKLVWMDGRYLEILKVGKV